MVKKPSFRAVIFVMIALVGLGFIGDGIRIKAKAALAQILLAKAFMDKSDTAQKPWAWADIRPFAKVSSPRLGTSNIVLDNASGEALAFGPGHLPDTPKPGERGTSVLSAHRDTHFAWLGLLKKGDAITVESRKGELFTYTVRRLWIAPFDASGIDADSDEKLLALTTCWPLDGTTKGNLRYIVEAQLDEPVLPEDAI